MSLDEHLIEHPGKLEPERLTETYEKLRDTTESDTIGSITHPHLAKLAGSELERAKDCQETARSRSDATGTELHDWYENAKQQPCSHWLDHHLGARHSFDSCMACGICASQCPAVRFHPVYSPRRVVDIALRRDEREVEALLSSDELWLCGQCGSCKARCPRGNSVMGLVSSLRQLAQLKGWHIRSIRGRQQYAARHLWGGNLWNRGMSMHFRNIEPAAHRDFGPRWETWFSDAERQMRRVGATPDEEGSYGGRCTAPEALAELRALIAMGGSLALWKSIEDSAAEDAASAQLPLQAYRERVGREG